MKSCLRYLTIAALIIGLLAPAKILAQTTPQEPGQDPFALSPELLQFFQGLNPTDPTQTSLFNGDNLKYTGLFTTPTTQLGGAAPLTAPVQETEKEFGPTLIRVTSKYEPQGNLTKDSVIKLTVTLTNIGKSTSPAIKLRATLEDANATLLPLPDTEPTPTLQEPGSSIDPGIEDNTTTSSTLTPEPPNPTPTQESDITDPEVGLYWTKNSADKDIIILPEQANSFTWYVQANQDDSILRWKFVAQAGAGESTLLQWIPIKNPNPTGVFSLGGGGGLSNVCTSAGTAPPYPSGTQQAVQAAFLTTWNVKLEDKDQSWSNPENEPFLKLYWDTLSAVSCTPFIKLALEGDPFSVYASSYPSGWGVQTSNTSLELNLANMLSSVTGNPASVQQNLIHEFSHAIQFRHPDIYSIFESTICGKGSPNAHVSGYGFQSCTEDFAEGSGYYAVRASHEFGGGFNGSRDNICPAKNPYDWGQQAYYNYYKQHIYGGKEFDSPPPSSGSC